MDEFFVREDKKGCTFRVHVVPGSHADAITGMYGDALRVRLKAPPVEGRANEALRSFLAEELGVSIGNVEILSGRASRQKLVRVTGARASQVRILLDIHPPLAGGS
jgi:hypothetical protein